MCGRITILNEPPVMQLLDSLDADPTDTSFADLPRLNIGPSEKLPIIRNNGSRNEVLDATWWLLLQATTEGFKANYQWKTFNARADRLRTSKLYRQPFKQTRCLIPLSAYYEWTKEGEQRLPHMIKPADGSVLTVAGLYKQWEGKQGVVHSCTIITTDGHPELASIHKKSTPALVPEALWNDWLNPELEDTQIFDDIFRANFETTMEVTPVDPEMNSSRVKNHACISAIGDGFTF